MKFSKQVAALLFISAMLTLAACESKPQTTKTDVDSTMITPTDTLPMADDNSVMVDSVMVADSTQR